MNTKACLLLLALCCPMLAGCGSSPAQPGGGPQQNPAVLVSLPESQEVMDYEDFPGRMEAVNAVEVRARFGGAQHTINATVVDVLRRVLSVDD